jgi:hypothetical protein
VKFNIQTNRNYMPYSEKLADEVHAIFDKCSDFEELESTFNQFVVAKTKESFINGLKAARNGTPKSKGPVAKQANNAK